MPRLATLFFAAGVAALPLAVSPAHAIEVVSKGNAILLSGAIKLGDEYVFRDRLAAEKATGLRTIWLASPGGSVDAAVWIARKLRQDGWTTVVDASRGACASACTILFSAGVRRHYIATERLKTGVVSFAEGRGLGYHQGGTSLSRQPGGFSGAATAFVIATYHEFGTPAAATLADLSPPNRIYVLPGKDALAKGIATSLSPP